MDLDDVQVGHRGSHDDMRVEVAGFQPVDDLAHQSGNVVGVGCVVDDAGVAAGDADRAIAPLSGALVALEVAGVEVQIKNDSVFQWKPGSRAITPTWSIARA